MITSIRTIMSMAILMITSTATIMATATLTAMIIHTITTIRRNPVGLDAGSAHARNNLSSSQFHITAVPSER